ncbi:Asp23/Gls24 family envelope stress response protein [Sphaerisporangium aureirubrum]|uniref:Asp23/Gls24 family envelope stress response protein n=1 Tax=Sphaerisporangium aureirubrum TaxID=1544736 RepID=A0ABW1NEW0_9ACTN
MPADTEPFGTKPAEPFGATRAGPSGPAAGGGSGARSAPEGRGRTRISDRVLEGIAARAAAEVDEAGRAARRVLGVTIGHDAPGATPRVTGHVDGKLATLHVHLSVAYPSPVRQVTRRVRDHVTSRVHDLTGLDVRQIDIDVDRLLPGPEPALRDEEVRP